MRAEHIGDERGLLAPRGLVTFSLEDGVPAARPADDSQDEALRVGVFETRAARQLCLIRNISRSGARVRVYRRYRIGTRATIDLKTGHRLAGTVTWAQMGHVGLEFDALVDVEALLSTESLAARGHRARLPRVECDCPVTLRQGASLIKGRAVDISQGGIKMEGGRPVSTGPAVILLPGLYPMTGEVRWSDSRWAGIAFEELIPFRRLLETMRAWSSGQDPEVEQARLRA